MAEPTDVAKEAAEGVANTAKEGVGMARRGIGWTLNQFNFIGKNGKFGRTFKIASGAALVGAGVALTGGASLAATLPFETALSTTMTAAAANTGTIAATSTTANTIATGTSIATSGVGTGSFMGAVGAVSADFAAHAANGVYFGGSEAIEFGKNVWANADWNTMQQGLSTFQTGLTGP